MVFLSWKRVAAMFISICSVLFGTVHAEETVSAHADVVHPIKVFRLTSPGERSLRVFQGQTEASQRTSLAFRVPGQLIEFPALAGQSVKKGELLARLDPIEYKLTKDKAEANYQLALVEFKRTERLVKDQLVSQQMHDQNRTLLARTKAALEQAQANVGYTSLRAPFDGVVSRTAAENWDYVIAKQQVLNIQADGMTDVKIQVPQNVVTQLSREFVLDLKALVRFVAQPQYSYFAAVTEVDTEADASTLSYEVTLSLPTPTDFNVSTGMTAEVEIDMSPLDPHESEYYVLPVTAVVGEGDNLKVWRIAPETMTVSAVDVEVIGQSAAGLKVKGPLTSGDILALTGTRLLSDGMRVQEWVRERGL
ncbi:efflux RND transporter periplasmic adaptor subunit [Corallincola luteus]|uniref:Efflux RND transporter periplasmic adaptor subunit n=3 Tax=Psychromonadaceae TaxID=267894 RepID=A0A368NK78_9GAMM|nr:efflux RND transporter periplasmic adaptor subunit [Corallincola holothuriorum]TCI01835.1 efflux RND transporter periplasmic adaptor subunit [Corallincola luteus]